MRAWMAAPKGWGPDHPVLRLLHAAGLFYPASRLYNRLLRRWIARGSGGRLDGTEPGTLTVQGVRFPFLDPELLYLPLEVIGKPYEPAVTLHLRSVIRPGTTFVDIGSEYGFYTAYVSTLEPGCSVHSFEPNPKFFAVLRENAKLCGGRAKVYRLALSDSSGTIPFRGRSMKPAGEGETDLVESIPFDEWREREGIRPDIVKVDVHGGEGKVLTGMKRTLREDVRHIYCELHPQALLVDCTPKDVLDLLIEAGFELFEMDRFRTADPPVLGRITEERYARLIDESRWTPGEVAQRRMIYGRKPPTA